MSTWKMEEEETHFDEDVAFADTPDEEKDLEEPKMYKVVFLNDDYTPMDYVSATLMHHFFKTSEEAEAITLQIHNTGKGIAGIYPKDIAITKSLIVNDEARAKDHPLRAEVEAE